MDTLYLVLCLDNNGYVDVRFNSDTYEPCVNYLRDIHHSILSDNEYTVGEYDPRIELEYRYRRRRYTLSIVLANLVRPF